jgi:hypothetical protein
MAEHTPGPWESHDVTDDQDADCGNWVVEIPETPGNTVIRLWFGDMESNTGEDIANANLVAAAPDLLAALEANLAGMSHVQQHGCQKNACSERRRLAELASTLVNAAIAKARGEGR